MINLIPPQGHSSLHLEYILRVASTVSILFGFLAIALAIAFIPTFVLIDVQIQTLDAEQNKELDKVEAVDQAEKEVARTRKVITQLRAGQGTAPMISMIDEVARLTPATISLTQYIISDIAQPKEAQTIQVQGTATTRDALAGFKKHIEASPLFEAAEIPIADLARETDLPFTMTITLQKAPQ